MRDDKVSGFSNRYRFLSNFYLAPFTYRGDLWPTVEHAYQAYKCADKNEFFEFFSLDTPREAKRKGRKVLLRSDWDDIKLNLMYDLVHAKFFQNKKLADNLKNTDGKYLEETNHWHDTYWGVCNGEGENNLGLILMKVREELLQ